MGTVANAWDKKSARRHPVSPVEEAPPYDQLTEEHKMMPGFTNEWLLAKVNGKQLHMLSSQKFHWGKQVYRHPIPGHPRRAGTLLPHQQLGCIQKPHNAATGLGPRSWHIHYLAWGASTGQLDWKHIQEHI